MLFPQQLEVRLVREKDKRKSQGSTHVHSCIIAQEGRSSYIGIFVHTTGPNQGSGESRIRQRPVDTHRMDHHQPISSQRSMF